MSEIMSQAEIDNLLDTLLSGDCYGENREYTVGYGISVLRLKLCELDEQMESIRKSIRILENC